ncbi:hypothetical protein Y1Q_0016822 [Alligator mississippiensis]|uniref:Uncharacterized protein n=1 Tax=Alligator mississippiensis TaxID=8496 RepID=A0A151P6M5_ALLMI|nr:hypothetical protein Y1Q_0016822 [Alligator mississippiensis]
MEPEMLDPGWFPGHLQIAGDICVDSTGNTRTKWDPQCEALEWNPLRWHVLLLCLLSEYDTVARFTSTLWSVYLKNSCLVHHGVLLTPSMVTCQSLGYPGFHAIGSNGEVPSVYWQLHTSPKEVTCSSDLCSESEAEMGKEPRHPGNQSLELRS